MSQINNTHRATMFILFIAAAITLTGAGCAPAKQVESNNGNTPAPVTTPSVLPNSAYKDGTYTAVGTYRSPAGAEEMGVTLTLKDNTITDVVIEPKATVPISKNIQTMFSENVKSIVVGKKISDVKLDKVSGASLTPKGFNDAVEKIKAQAAA